MSADIGAIMQLLQRQMALVPPAYSAVSSPPQVTIKGVLITALTATIICLSAYDAMSLPQINQNDFVKTSLETFPAG